MTMRLLLIHQNFPGQFRHILQHYAHHHPGQIVGLGDMTRVHDNIRGTIPGATHQPYRVATSELSDNISRQNRSGTRRH